MRNREQRFRHRLSKRRENITGGILLLGIGGILLARQVGGIDLPGWLFTWPSILIIVGLFVGVKTNFKDFGWLILVGIGTFFLTSKMHDVPFREFIWPFLIIGVGLIFLLRGFFRKPRNIADEDSIQAQDMSLQNNPAATAENVMEVISIFGSTKRVVLSKNFKGGEIISIFGSSEINLTNADFTGTLVLEVVQIFGGTKLIIPPHWEVQSQTATIFGGIEDKRSIQGTGSNSQKILVIDGATIFGGVTISSY